MFRLHPGRNISTPLCIAFLAQLRRQIRGPIAVLWDRFPAHRSRKMERHLRRHPRILSFHFPPYAPERNPIEYGWAYLKTNPLANDAPENELLLARRARKHLRKMGNRPNLLRSFIDHAGLSFFD
jgi:putative transposase